MSLLSRRSVLALTLLTLTLTVSAQSGYVRLGPVTSVTNAQDGIQFESAGLKVRITALSSGVIRLRYTRLAEFPRDFSFAVVKETGLQTPAIERVDDTASFGFKTPALSVHVERASGRVTFLDSAGKVITDDQPGRPAEWNGSEFRIYKAMPQDEHYFGLGDKSSALDRRDAAFTMWTTDAFGWQEGTDPLYKAIPFFLALRQGRAYGVFLDNTYRSSFDFGKQSRDYYSFGADGGELNYYFIYGPSPRQVLSAYTALIGRTPLPPLWALGYQQCRYTYFPQGRLLDVAAELRRRHIPADALYLDIHYLRDYRAYDINREYFPDFEKDVRQLSAEGFKLVVITDPHLARKPGYVPYDSGHDGDFFVKNPDGTEYVGKVWPGDSVFPDFTREAARAWYGTLNKMFTDMGVRGFWNDMNEPAVFTYPDKTMPLDTVHRIEEGDYRRTTDHREIHNVYGMENVRATYEGLLKLQPDQRPFVLTRAGYAGTQRYAATWTGDNQATWLHYRLSLTTLLSLGISGYPLVGNDVGGFDGSPTPELFTRWMELGAFFPLFRNHSAVNTLDKEPWVHGEYQEDIRRRYIEARYRLLPYLYTSMEETSRTGVPLMRPMFVEYSADDSVSLKDKQFLFGDDLLVAPKLEEKLDPYTVSLPAGPWYDYWTGQRIEGGKDVTLDSPLDVLPVYARGGAIIPHEPLVQNTTETPQGPLELRVYPGPDCRGSLYLDAGDGFEYQRGVFFRQQFTCEASASGATVKLSTPEGPYKPWWKSVDVVIVNGGQWQGEPVVTVNGIPPAPERVSLRDNGDAVVHLAATTEPIEVRVSYSAP